MLKTQVDYTEAPRSKIFDEKYRIVRK